MATSVIVEVINKTRYNNAEKKAKLFLETSIEILKKEKYITEDEISISVAIIGQQSIRKLNRKYRKKDQAADVLSFVYEHSKKKLSGEIVICPSYIEKYAEKDKKKFSVTFKENLAHGLLHIVGFGHSGKMFEIQRKLVAI